MYAGRFSYDQQNVHDEQQWANQASYQQQPSQQHYNSQQYNYPPPNQQDRFQNNGAGYPQQGGRGGYQQGGYSSGYPQQQGAGYRPRYQQQHSYQNSRWSRLDESGGGGGGGGGLATNWEQQGPANAELEAELFSR